ncbi:MAG: Npt1/Npt2 family nucleotide transporter [Candidatus Eremiobacterota bacterium]
MDISRERAITILSFLWIFILMTGYYIIKPIRDTFINELPYETYPYLLIITMVVILLVNYIYDFLARVLSSSRLILFMTLFFGAGLCVFPFLLNRTWPSVDIPFAGVQPGKYICIVLYSLFVGIYNLFSITMFWSFVNEVFSIEESKNFFGSVTAGGTVGGLLGSWITSILASKMQIANLLFISALLLFVTLIFMCLLIPYKRTDDIIMETPDMPVMKTSGFSMIFTSSYLRWMILAMFLTTSGGTMLGYQMNVIVKNSISEQAARAEFWANIYILINCLGLFFQLLLVRPVVNRFGLKATLLISPLVDLTGSFLLTCSQTLPSGQFCFAGRYSSEYSFNRASREMLFIPKDRDFKYQAKAIVDTFIFRLGDGLTSLLLIVLKNSPLQYIALLSLLVNLLRIIPAIALAKEYEIVKGEK